ncbi:hypothetical protein [Sphaerisporangium sp. NPDC051011]
MNSADALHASNSAALINAGVSIEAVRQRPGLHRTPSRSVVLAM